MLYTENLKSDIGSLGRRGKKMGEGAELGEWGTERNGNWGSEELEGC